MPLCAHERVGAHGRLHARVGNIHVAECMCGVAQARKCLDLKKSLLDPRAQEQGPGLSFAYKALNNTRTLVIVLSVTLVIVSNDSFSCHCVK